MTCPCAQEPSPRLADRAIAVPGGRLRTRIEGAGSDILLLHGLSAHSGEWDAVAARLAARFRVIRPDLAGRGGSDASAAARFRLEDETARTAALLEAVGVSRPLVVGHSHGAAIAVALAARRSCAGLLLLNPVTPWTARPRFLGLLRPSTVRACATPILRHFRRPLTRYILTRRVYADPGSATRSAVERYAGPLAETGNVRQLLRVLADWRPAELVAPVSPVSPLAVIAGRHDRRVRPGEAARWAAVLGAEFEVFEDCAHGIPEEAPDRVATRIDRLHDLARETIAREHQE